MKRVMDLSFPVWSRLSLAACALAMFAATGNGVSAQQTAKKPHTVSAAVHPTVDQTETPSGENKPAKSGHEGITVHGHWVIDVRNPDGSLAQHREFENSLVNGGPQVLSQMLAGAVVPGNWSVVLGPATGNGPCSNNWTLNGGSGTSENCEIVQSLATAPAVGDCLQNICAAGLAITGPETVSILLSGTIVSNQTGTIGVVSTELAYCLSPNSGGAFSITPTPSTVSPVACVAAATQAGPFTSTTLTTVLKPGATPTPNPIPVTAGQTILASVTLSFS